jgi:hypothetical protein
MTVVYHVCSISKLERYQEQGRIIKPVRAWENINSAERFSKQTSRPIILRLKFPNLPKRLEGHRGEAFFIEVDYKLPKELLSKKKRTTHNTGGKS